MTPLQGQLRLRRDPGDPGLQLRLFRDPDASSRAFAHGAGWGLAYLGAPTRAQRGTLDRIAMALRSASSPNLATLVDELVAQVPELERMRLWPGDFEPPRPWEQGRLPLLAGVDPRLPELELLDLLADTDRVLIKREIGLEQDLAAIERSWREHGVSTRIHRAASSDGAVVFGACSQDVLDEAAHREGRIDVRAPDSASAVEWLGSRLGYPVCCVRAFLGLSRRDDFSAAQALLPPWPHRAHPPETLWLNPYLTPSSHFPCSLDCPHTVRRAREVLGLADAAIPGTLDRWRAAASRLHVMSAAAEHVALEIDAHGRIRQGTRYTGPGLDVQRQPIDPAWVDQSVEPHHGGLRTPSGELWGILVSHHGEGCSPMPPRALIDG